MKRSIPDLNTRPIIADPNTRFIIADLNARFSIADPNTRPLTAETILSNVLKQLCPTPN